MCAYQIILFIVGMQELTAELLEAEYLADVNCATGPMMTRTMC